MYHYPFRYFKDYKLPEYAKAGEIPTEDIIIPAGEIPFPPSLMDQFRKLGLIVEIDDGKLILREPYTAAKAGNVLTPEQAKILTHFEKPIALFAINLVSHWSEGEFSSFT